MNYEKLLAKAEDINRGNVEDAAVLALAEKPNNFFKDVLRGEAFYYKNRWFLKSGDKDALTLQGDSIKLKKFKKRIDVYTCRGSYVKATQ